MTTDDLRKRAREAAEQYAPTGSIVPGIRSSDYVTLGRNIGFAAGYLAHAAQQPSREQIAEALISQDWDEDADDSSGHYLGLADAAADYVRRALDGPDE